MFGGRERAMREVLMAQRMERIDRILAMLEALLGQGLAAAPRGSSSPGWGSILQNVAGALTGAGAQGADESED